MPLPIRCLAADQRPEERVPAMDECSVSRIELKASAEQVRNGRSLPSAVERTGKRSAMFAQSSMHRGLGTLRKYAYSAFQ
jgi:hypothetical protein